MAQPILADVTAPTGSRRWQRADGLALLVGAVGLVLTASVGGAAFLRGDDWALLSIVSRPDFGPVDIFRPYGSHLMPLGLGAFWSLRGVFGATPWWPLVGFGLVFVATALAATWATIRLLVGPRMAAVVPFALAAWGPAGMAAVMWPSPSVYMTPLWAATAGAVYVYVRGRLGLSRHWHWWILAIVGLSLFAIEIGLLIIPLLFVIEASWFTTAGPVESVRLAWRRQIRLWAALIVMAVCYAAVYYLLSKQAETLPQERAGIDLLIEGLVLVMWKVLPAMVVAGPWVWDAATAPRIATGFGLTTAVALLAWFVIWRARRAGGRAWLPLLGLMVLTVLALSAARVAVFGSTVLLNPYYYIEGLGILATTLAIGYLPSRLPVDRGGPLPDPRLLRVVLVLLAGSALLSAAGYARAVPAIPERAYLVAAAQSLTQPTLNTASPRDVFGVFLYTPPFDTAEHTLSFAGVDGNWVMWSADPHMLDTAGDRVRLDVQGVPLELPGPCVAVDAPTALVMPDNRDPNWPAFELHYRAERDTSAGIRLDDEVLDVALAAGEGTVYFVGPARQGTLDISAPGACVRSVEMGAAVPLG